MWWHNEGVHQREPSGAAGVREEELAAYRTPPPLDSVDTAGAWHGAIIL
jgi:hypothetical protein